MDQFENTITDYELVNWLGRCSPENREETHTVTQSVQVRSEPSARHLEVLQTQFGHNAFKPLQWDIIWSIIEHHRDVCAIMSTGYGKSLCFQYPAVFLQGITLVISPLIALMEDQVLALETANIPACFLGTAQTNHNDVVKKLFSSFYKIVYITPEFSQGDRGRELLGNMSRFLKMSLIAIDEAHCISSWGHDFRNDYRKLKCMREIFPQTPIIALTATATPRVREDIINNLHLYDPLKVCSGFDRPNLYLNVQYKSVDITRDLQSTMTKSGSMWVYDKPTIIYCITRKETEDIAARLQKVGVNCLPYHAGLAMEVRKKAHELFVTDKVNVIVATIAFGMGIDKPDIRNVVHYGCSKSLESYYQEVGRAGRDGLPAKCTTFFSPDDFKIHSYLSQSSANNKEECDKRLNLMKNYLRIQTCRHKFILDYFGEVVPDTEQIKENCCDNCERGLKERKFLIDNFENIDENGCYDFTEYARILLNFISASSRATTETYFCHIRTNFRISNLPGFGAMFSPDLWQDLMGQLITRNYISMEETMILCLTKKGTVFIEQNQHLSLPPKPSLVKFLKRSNLPEIPHNISSLPTQLVNQPAGTSREEDINFTRDKDVALYNALQAKRLQLAQSVGCFPYQIALNSVLIQIAKSKPKTLEELRQLNLSDFSETQISKYGEELVNVVGADDPVLQKSSIQEIVTRYPLCDTNIPQAVKISCQMLDSGLTAGEIANNRSVCKEVIESHLISGIKYGFPIRISELGASEDKVYKIIKAIREICGTGFAKIPLPLIQERCSGDVTATHISAVLAYLEVREHIHFLGIPYNDFEDFCFYNLEVELEKLIKVETT